MNTRSSTSLSSLSSRASGPVIDLGTLDQIQGAGWARLLLSLGLGGVLLIAAVFAVRFYVLTQIQPPVEAQLEFLAHWLGLSSGLTGMTWVLTFGLSALFVTPLIKKFLFIVSGGLSIFRPKARDWALLLASPLAGLIPQAVEMVVPVREVDPSVAAWFHAVADKATQQPRGRIGFVREPDGRLCFYNIPEVLRDTDGRRIERVTTELRQEWESRRADQEKQRASEEADRQKREELRRQHEENMARLRAEVAREEAARMAAQKAEAEAARAKAEAEKVRVHAAENARREAQAAAEKKAAQERQRSLDKQADLERAVEASRQPQTDRVPLHRGHILTIHPQNRRVVLWTDGPAAVRTDWRGEWQIREGQRLEFPASAQPIHVEPRHPYTHHVFVQYP